jgi:cyclopropane-fatty-acyl-phospholipid synthase
MFGMFWELKRWLLLIPEAIVCGPSYARFLFWIRERTPLDASTTWARFTKPQSGWLEWWMNNYPPPFIRQFFLDAYYRRSMKFLNHSSGIIDHYDLSNSFYELFLDKRYMFYTGADFQSETETLEEAQENKANYLLKLIEPAPGEKILDLGCGWGAMLKKIADSTSSAELATSSPTAATKTSDSFACASGNREHLYGYTLSTEQKKFIDEKYGFHAELKDFITTDYEPASFDKIFSIGSLEHVREQELLPLARKLTTALKPQGKIVHQIICQTGPVFPTRLLALALLIFPGSELTDHQYHLDTFTAANLQVIHQSVHDYRPTLKAWFDRLVANQARAIELVGIQNYNKYQCYFAEAWRLFENQELMLRRYVLQHPASAASKVS